ncbi:uncharacterized protein LOC18445531 [Amborella trichopoda]|nr:uncharacterized protein LOC18445531 [Amborella trichopoda]|eukprot:XP_006855730.2 uncharacterized protein LOC18445531 [Amborella trichopoda]
MGGILHLFDFNQAGMSRKLLTHKRHADGLEAPRNSLDLPVDSMQSSWIKQDNTPFSCQVKQSYTTKDFYHNGTPMKLLIDQEMSKETEAKRNVPSVVARLMGVDSLPVSKKAEEPAKERENLRKSMPIKEQNRNGLTSLSSISSKFSRKNSPPLISQKKEQDEFINSLKPSKPRPREHPQEKQLQKFKKEFEAWQASKVLESSKSVDLSKNFRQWKDNQTIAQEILNKEKMALYLNPTRKSIEKERETITILSSEGVHQGKHRRPLHVKPTETAFLSVGNKPIDHSNHHGEIEQQRLPTRIVILKPGPEKSDEREQTQSSSTERLEEDGSIQDFLEEVRERLRLGLQENIRKDPSFSNNGIEFENTLRDPKEIARRIANQVRDRVGRERELDSPEFMSRDTRKFLSERLKNILSDESVTVHPVYIHGSSIIPAASDRIAESFRERKNSRFSRSTREETETKAISFRHERSKGEIDNVEVSPRNLVRSLSAPVSGTSFGKLLLEDQPIITGAQIRRKHEASESVSVEVRKSRRERFSLRGKVSSLRYSLTLRGRLFRKKIESAQAMEGSDELPSIRAIVTEQSIEMNVGVAQENSTEVPPSPVSVGSGNQERDFFGAGEQQVAAVSTSSCDYLHDEISLSDPFKEISSDLQELRRQLGLIESGRSNDSIEPEYSSCHVEGTEDEAKTYIKDILVTSGFFYGSAQIFSNWASPTTPIGPWVHEKVEEAYKRGSHSPKYDDKIKSQHKLLFDLLNETLICILGPFVSWSRPKRRVRASMVVPTGKRLLEDAWSMMRMYVHEPMDGQASLEGQVAKDLSMTQWMGMVDDDVDVIGKDMEGMILGDLVEEVLSEWCS